MTREDRGPQPPPGENGQGKQELKALPTRTEQAEFILGNPLPSVLRRMLDQQPTEPDKRQAILDAAAEFWQQLHFIALIQRALERGESDFSRFGSREAPQLPDRWKFTSLEQATQILTNFRVNLLKRWDTTFAVVDNDEIKGFIENFSRAYFNFVAQIRPYLKRAAAASDEEAPKEEQRETVEQWRERLVGEIRKNFTFSAHCFGFGRKHRYDGASGEVGDEHYALTFHNNVKHSSYIAYEESRGYSALGSYQDRFNLYEREKGTDFREHERAPWDVVGYGSYPQYTLGDLVEHTEKDRNTPARFIRMRFNISGTDLARVSSRPADFPGLIIVVDKELQHDILDFLWQNPDQYYPFISALYEPDKNVDGFKQYVLNQVRPTNEVVFLNMKKLPPLTSKLYGSAFTKQHSLQEWAYHNREWASWAKQDPASQKWSRNT